MLVRSSSSPLLNSLKNPLKEGNESDLRKCKSVQLSAASVGVITTPASRQLHVAEDCHGNLFRNGDPSAPLEFRRAQSDGNLQQQNMAGPGRRQCPRKWSSRNPGSPAMEDMPGEISLEEVLRNGRLEESLEETEDCGSEIRAGSLERDALGHELQKSSDSHRVALVADHRSDRELSAMYIAGGLGFGDGGGPSGGGGRGGRGGSSGSDSNSTDAYYQKMLEANPGHPLLLRNYARFLHEVLRDYPKAEEYYGRAILANPGDGDVLSLYAKLIWDVHRDAGRAEVYFDQAVEAAPDDCYVLGSYAHFLWNAEDDGDGDPLQENLITPAFHGTTTPTAV